MCARSANFNSALFLAACGLLTAGSDDIANDKSLPLLRDDPRCSPRLRVVLNVENSDGNFSTTSRTPEKNSSHLHDDIPDHLRWTDGNVTYGCVCKFHDCIRKCCRSDEVLREDLTKQPVCQKMIYNGTMSAKVKDKTPDLRLSKEQMAEEVQHGQLKDYFLLVESSVCPARTYALNSDEFQEDKFILQANGSFIDAGGKMYPFWDYCIDWQMTFDRIAILICLTQDDKHYRDNIIETVHHVGIAVSIPLLAATFLVYAIIPELKNLYGKTLMCYVICLITAYVSLLLDNYTYMVPKSASCIITGKQPPCNSGLTLLQFGSIL